MPHPWNLKKTTDVALFKMFIADLKIDRVQCSIHTHRAVSSEKGSEEGGGKWWAAAGIK